LAEQASTPTVDLAAFGIEEHDAEVLLDLAEVSIRARLAGGRAPDIDTGTLPPSLAQPLGAFVSLHVAGELNGCIGNIGGTTAIAVSVAELAVKAAFEDPRLPALRPDDLAALDIEISVLSARVEVPARTRSDLLAQLRPGEHGLVLRSGHRHALFLPSVWEQLPHPDLFVDQLLRKAGLPSHAWPADVLAELFTTATVRRALP
jgi:AmmeMemoRadiSam system protein A